VNIYRIIEEGVDSCIKAKTMHEAVKVCEDAYINVVVDGVSGEYLKVFEKSEREYYQLSILESCELVGELKN